MSDEIISVGIDIGTSTMQLIFSRLIIENLASDYSVPNLSIKDKKIIYESDIMFTPMMSDSEIDICKAKSFIEDQYLLANINYSDVQTGAVIITGESARKDNADRVLEELSGFAGDFVVATAGPSLESVLSGIGAGADLISKEENTSIANIDIGGGTSNISYFNKGKLQDVCCLDIGGRLVKLDKRSNKVTYVFNKIKELAKIHGVNINSKEEININSLENVAGFMVNIIAESIGLKESSKELDSMFTNQEEGLRESEPPRGITFSGGVGDCIYKENKDMFKYEDIGIILAEEIKKSKYFKNIKIYKPKETLRATVIGAGMHTTEISGSTIYIDESNLPLKNVPILKIEDDEVNNMGIVIEKELQLFFDSNVENAAIAFGGYTDTSFESIQNIAKEIVKGSKSIIDSNKPLIIVIENDIGKALGNTLLAILKDYNKIICIDKIKTLSCDYIDIGKPIAGGKVVPVIIKTLIFNK